MGRLSSHDERPTDNTGQAARDQTGRGRRNLEKTDGKVPASGDGAGGKGGLRMEQLSGGVEAGTEGGIHAMRVLWQDHSQEEDLRFLLIDARNEFNEENRIAMLWAVWHEWPNGQQFTFNLYCH